MSGWMKTSQSTSSPPGQSLPVGDREGMVLPACQVSGGLVLLAELSEDHLEAVYAEERYTDRPGERPDMLALPKDLAQRPLRLAPPQVVRRDAQHGRLGRRGRATKDEMSHPVRSRSPAGSPASVGDVIASAVHRLRAHLFGAAHCAPVGHPQPLVTITS
jgi:hypothetical protein